jgi:hypothetical protein
MTIVRVSCSECGDVEVDARDVTVRCCDETMHFAYRVHCPRCSMPIVNDADDDAVTLLLEGEARTERWHLPLELYEHPVGAAPINTTDLLDFHEAIGRLPS